MKAASGHLKPQDQSENQLRVFVSSTFLDMKAEREELVKQVFPRLRKKCELRGVVWSEIDLRWGVRTEEAAEQRALVVCLEEIARCNCFVGMLGERYGTIPGYRVGREGPPLEDGSTDGLRSITDMEMTIGALQNPKMKGRAFIYFRHPGYLDRLPRNEKRPDFENEGGIHRSGLDQLKIRIEQALPLRRPYREIKEFGAAVYEDVSELIDVLFPVSAPPSWLERERFNHDAFAGGHTHLYVSNPTQTKTLDEHVAGASPPLTVTGDAGLGKSALLAKWVEMFRKKHPRIRIIVHYVGACAASVRPDPDSPADKSMSADWTAMLRRIMGELRNLKELPEDVPSDHHGLRCSFANDLAKYGKQGPFVLVVDGLDKLEDREGAQDLSWLPRELAPNARIILSTLPGKPLAEVMRRGWPIVTLTPWQGDVQKRKLLQRYFDTFGKKLDESYVGEIVASPQTGNPLYLCILMEELRVYGERTALGAVIKSYLEAQTPAALFSKVLQRYEVDYDRDRVGLTRDVMTLLWCSRRGLTERELLDLLGTRNRSLPASYWSPLHLAAERALLDRGGVIGFAHDQLRQAVKTRYLKNENSLRRRHLELARYFAKREISTRTVDERPWQLMQARDWSGLAECLGDLSFFGTAWESSPQDIKEYWAQIARASEHRLQSTYERYSMGEAVRADPIHLWYLSLLLRDQGDRETALSILGKLERRFGSEGRSEWRARMLGNQAVIEMTLGYPDRALDLLAAEEQVYREIGDENGLQRCLGNQGNVFAEQGLLEDALARYTTERRLCEDNADRAGLAACLGNLAVLRQRRGEYEEARALHREEEHIYRELGDLAGLARSYGNQARVAFEGGDTAGAQKLIEAQKETCERLGDPEGSARALGNAGILAYARKDWREAERLAREQRKLAGELNSPEIAGKALSLLGLTLRNQGRLEEALCSHLLEMAILERLHDWGGLCGNLHNQALVYEEQGDLVTAEACLARQHHICCEKGLGSFLPACLISRARITARRGSWTSALAAAEAAIQCSADAKDQASLNEATRLREIIAREMRNG